MRTAASAKSSPGSEAARGVRGSPRVVRASALALLAGLAIAACRTPAPPPQPEPPAREAVVSWQVDPSSGYRPETGFVILEYLPPERLAGTPDATPGGRLVVHLGYRKIGDANTVWYRCEVFEGRKQRLRLDGEEGIPNVKDPDGYWWNDLAIDLDEPVTDEIRVVVTDTRTPTAYAFVVRKVVTYR